jgi:hypothetical protein
MSNLEIGYLALVIGGFALFSAMLAYVTAITGKR